LRVHGIGHFLLELLELDVVAGLPDDRRLDLARTHELPVARYEISDLHEDLSTLAKLERGRAAGA